MTKHESKGSGLLPLFILFVFICIALAIAYVAYSIAQEVAAKTEQKMKQKNITFSKDGLKVGVKEVSADEYEGTTQNMLVKMWNNASFKGRFDSWSTPSTTTPAAAPGLGAEKRKPFSRSSSGQQSAKRA